MESTGISIASIVAVALGIVGAILLIMILKWINKKLHIFTRGTVSFILAALLIFTAVDTLQILNGIKLNQHQVQNTAARKTAASIVTSWINDGASIAAHQVDGDGDRDYVLEKLQEIEEGVVEQICETNCSKAEKFKDLKLVALNLDIVHGFSSAITNDRTFRYRALVDDGQAFHRIQGRIRVGQHGGKELQIKSIDGELDRRWEGTDWNARIAYRYADDFQAESYEERLGRNNGSRVVSSTVLYGTGGN